MASITRAAPVSGPAKEPAVTAGISTADVRSPTGILTAALFRHRLPLCVAGTANAPFHAVMALATCLATVVEKRRPLPVDAIIPDPIFTSTHAITIDAPPEQVWPWMAQMGSGRAGWYSWDAIDNGGTPSATAHRARVPDGRPGRHHAGGSWRQGRLRRRRRRSAAGSRADGSRRPRGPIGRMGTPSGAARSWTHAAHRARTGVLALAGSRAREATRWSPPHLHRARLCGARETAASAAHRRRHYRSLRSWNRGTCGASSVAARRPRHVANVAVRRGARLCSRAASPHLCSMAR